MPVPLFFTTPDAVGRQALGEGVLDGGELDFRWQ
jgi:hypothetical protein